MKKRNKNLADTATLRQKAENLLKCQPTQANLQTSEADMLKLIHELQVHQIELEMQNDELVIAKERAELAEEKYAELYDFAPSGYLSLSEKCEITGINFEAARMLGKERSLLIKKRFDLFVSVNTQATFNHFFRDVFSRKAKQTCEIMLSINDNLPIYLMIDGNISQSGNLCLLTLTDITKRKLAEINLLESNIRIEESENKFQQLVANIDECFWLRDDNKILYVSPGFEKIWGIPCQCLYDNPQLFSEKIHPDDKSVVLKILQSDNFRKNGIFNYDYRIIREDKEVRWINAKSFPVMDHNGKFIRRAGIAIDITEKIQKHQELIKAKEHAEESDRLKSAFLANMSHEIRTPMNGILGFAELLKNQELTGDEQQEYIKIIEKSGARMLNIINDIIDISKIEAGLMELDIRLSNINEQIEYIYTFFKPEVDTKGIMFSFKNSLPIKESFIYTDREKVYAIFTNMVKNAIKFSNKGAIEFGYLTKGDFLEFYVKDTGIGIPKNRQKAIFERFIQADIKDQNATQGAGLGLAITKAYIEMLGGKLWVESEEDIGSTFYFTLPYNTEQKKIATQKDLLFDLADSSFTSEASGLKILIAEDDNVSGKLLDIDVEKVANVIIKARTGVEAVESCRNNPDIDLVLMDVRMPEMDGYQATRQIRQFNKNVIIIAQTAYGLSGDREKAIENECNDYITKPIRKSELLALIQKYFNK
jgi:PAS domain S-box-containing protein